MKTNILAIVLVVVLASVSMAELPFKTSIYTRWTSEYISPAGGSCSNGKDVWQSGISFSFSDTTFGIWHNGANGSDIFDNENEAGSEIDLSLNQNFNLGNGVEATLGVAYWFCGNISDTKEGDVIFTKAEIRKTYTLSDTQALTHFAKVSGYFVTDGFPGDGVVISTGLRHFWKIDKILSANSEIRLMYDDGIFCGDNGFVLALGTTLSWPITPKLSLQAPYMEFFTPVTVHDARESEFVFGFGATYNF